MRSILLALALIALAACGSKSELAVCGNGVVEPGEPCDGTVPFTCYEGTLACDVDCELDDSACTSYCGDDTINGPGGAEACDGTDLPVACNDGGTIACRTDCTLDRSGCGGGSCGDGTRNGEEECDGVDVDTICHEGTLTCDADCALITTACASYCGDEEVTGAEACDTTPAACHGSGATVCNRDCTIDPAGCTGGYCGDGVRNGPEACDGGDPCAP